LGTAGTAGQFLIQMTKSEIVTGKVKGKHERKERRGRGKENQQTGALLAGEKIYVEYNFSRRTKKREV
jgi:hypothetical protein